jgi:hypothetical protein
VTLDGRGHLLVVGDIGWSDGAWHHVAATFTGAM